MDSDDECCYYFDDDDIEDGGETMVMDEDDVGLLDSAASPPPPEHRAVCWAITKESLAAAQQQDLSMVMNLVNIERHNARALLGHHRWKMDRIYDRIDMIGREALLREAGIVAQQEKSSSSSSAMAMAARSVAVTCNVCFDEFPPGAVSAMDCGHIFCNVCWTEYFAAAVGDGSKLIRCMEVKCTAICDEAVVRRLLLGSRSKHPGAAARLDRLLLEAYVEGSDSVRWCPSAPHCGCAIRVDSGERYSEVSCPCGVGFCFNCGREAHSPCPCPMWDKWATKRGGVGGGEVDNLKWIVANTKSCPKCSKPIEKNGGCNHVTCTCGQHLCYSCGAATGTLYLHICNRYKEGGVVKVDTAGGRELQRFTHYYERFEIHTDSYKKEKRKLGPAVDELVRREADAALPWSGTRDAGWPAAAHRRLLRWRQVLPRSYVLAYYMFGGGAKTRREEAATLAAAQNRFEDLQGQLEHHVEKLSKTLAAAWPDKKETILKAKHDADNLARLVEGLCAGMYRCVQDELLPLLVEPMSIAAYHQDGPAKAKEFPATSRRPA